MASASIQAVVLLSAGLDSTVNLYMAHEEFGSALLALTFDYGQTAASKEILRASASAQVLKIRHEVIDLKWFEKFTHSALHGKQKLVQGEEVDILSHEHSLETAKNVWVPNRNGIFLNIAAGFAEGAGAKYVIPGFNAEEAQTFPDNSRDFMSGLEQSLRFSTANHVEVKCYTADMDKIEIFEKARDIGIPEDHLWPCYLDGEEWCCRCESCLRYIRARSKVLSR